MKNTLSDANYAIASSGNTTGTLVISQANVTYTGAGDIANATKQGWYGQAVNVLSPL